MEQSLLGACDSVNAVNNDKLLLPREILASMRSLIINPHTSDSTFSTLLETLTRSLQLTASDTLTHHHILKLLVELASSRPHLAPPVLISVRSSLVLSSESPRLAIDCLSALTSISESDRISSKIELDDQLFVSLCFGPSVTSRLWLLRNAGRFGVQSHVLFTVFFGFTKDPYPYVREAALNGLTGLCRAGVVFDDLGAIEGCFFRAAELLQDMEDCVRHAAVPAVSEWGKMLIAANQEEDKRAWSDVVFIKLCSMVRDMNMAIRVEAFNALGKMQMLSEDVLLQSLSKKVLRITKEKESNHQYLKLKVLASSAAGAYVHGLEDEFHEVRKSACYSLRMLSVLSAEFAGQALDLLMDMLNDDSMPVRLEALETMHQMAIFECLNVQESHMHMFLGTLLDGSDPVRSTARKIFKLVKLSTFGLFRLSINGLLENLKVRPQDEADVFLVLFYMGQNHGKFAARLIKEVSVEIEPVSEGQLTLDTTRVAAFLVLSISTPLSSNRNGQQIPPAFFSYAVALLGRISSALIDIMDQNTLLAYLSQCSRSLNSFCKEVEGGELPLPVVDNVPGHPDLDDNKMHGTHMLQIGNETFECQSLTTCKSRDAADSLTVAKPDDHEASMKSINFIFAKVKNLWHLVQCRCINEALKILRALKEEIIMFASQSPEFGSELAFTLHYLRVMDLLIRIWAHVVWKVQSYEMGELDILLGKLDRRMRAMRCRFIGCSKEEEVHVLELVAVTCILRLSRVEICCHLDTLRKLSDTISCIEFLQDDGSVEPSDFVAEVKKELLEVDTSVGFCSHSSIHMTKLLNLFTPKQLNLCGGVRHASAELDVLGNDSEHPILFVTGLPVAVPLGITLHNVETNNRLWLKITMTEDSTEYVFLDLILLEVFDEVKKFTFVAPFYKTPKAISLTLRVSIGMECSFDEVHFVRGCGGPKHALVYLCQEKEVYMVQRN